MDKIENAKLAQSYTSSMTTTVYYIPEFPLAVALWDKLMNAEIMDATYKIDNENKSTIETAINVISKDIETPNANIHREHYQLLRKTLFLELDCLLEKYDLKKK